MTGDATSQEYRDTARRGLDGALPRARIVGTELHHRGRQDRGMRRVTAQDAQPAAHLLQDEEAELGVDGPALLNKPIAHEFRRVESTLAELRWSEMTE